MFDSVVNAISPEDFIYICLTTNNYEEDFFLRDTIFYRFNNNIVEHTNSRLLIARLPKNLYELAAPWPVSSFVQGDYKVLYINEVYFNDPSVVEFIDHLQLGCIFIPESMDESKGKEFTKNVTIPVVKVKAYKFEEDFDNEIEAIISGNKQNLFKDVTDKEKYKNAFNDKTKLSQVNLPSVNFLLPMAGLINRNRGLYPSIYSGRELVSHCTPDIRKEKEFEAIEWNLHYLKQFLVEKYILLCSKTSEGIDNLIEKLPANYDLKLKNDLTLEELEENFEYFSEYYQENMDEIDFSIDMIFSLPMVNKYTVETLNDLLKKNKLPRRLMKKFYDESGYYGTYKSANSDKEELYIKILLNGLKTRLLENRVIDSLFVNYALGSKIPYIRLPNVPASNINLWYSHMYRNVIRNSELLEVEKFNENKRKIGNSMKEIVGEDFLDLIGTYGKHIKFVSDAPVEWIEYQGLPLAIEKSISRLPIIPGNSLISHTYNQKYELSYNNLKVLVINALDVKDKLYSYGKKLEAIYRKELGGFEESFVYKEPKNCTDFVDFIEEVKPTILVFYGHGSFNSNEYEGRLYIKEDFITAVQLESITWSPVITILGACETQTVDNHYLNIGNMFIMSGSISVLATYFPVDAFFTFTFLESLFRNLNNTLRNEAPPYLKNWSDVILQARRSHYLLEPLKVVSKYLKKKKVKCVFENDDLLKHVVNFCMNKVENDISEAYRYREDAYKDYFKDNAEAFQTVTYLFKHKYVFDESLIFASLGSPEKIKLIR